ncbi:LPS export ABC transporter periplasmic protein LptC [Hirschia litorea]|uniref:LPS export ABC transporter periplasmic protein LptC n=1 Tax=Hirschia litorea TaxID=1199156 RepID=A0ABW2IM50_9PROT
MNALTHNKMDLWEPRRATTLSQARFRSSLVGLIRMLFMAGIAISAGWLIGPIIVHGFMSGSNTQVKPVNGITMLNPRFTGRDNNGNAFTLTAGTAKRRIDELEVVDLQNPVLEDGIGGIVRAKAGVYDRERQLLTLSGDVHLVDASEYELRTQNAIIYVSENRVVGDYAIDGDGPLGEFRADSFEVMEGGKKTVLTGNVWTRIVSADQEAAN